MISDCTLENSPGVWTYHLHRVFNLPLLPACTLSSRLGPTLEKAEQRVTTHFRIWDTVCDLTHHQLVFSTPPPPLSSLERSATYTLSLSVAYCCNLGERMRLLYTKQNTLPHTASHRTAPHRTATHCNALQRTATHCTALHRTAMHCDALQRTATNETRAHRRATRWRIWSAHCTSTKRRFVISKDG